MDIALAFVLVFLILSSGSIVIVNLFGLDRIAQDASEQKLGGDDPFDALRTRKIFVAAIVVLCGAVAGIWHFFDVL
ncbi:hypothetical protein [Burkholderia cenocepacia]|uniref:hypothetical protein n=1 Tax=Burkholderia cenocepacia TaxID=95486 RepID=UPI00084676FD|nr:hypothetical protein [Burkholderia cenocepacia]